jgi:hypothetical protein
MGTRTIYIIISRNNGYTVELLRGPYGNYSDFIYLNDRKKILEERFPQLIFELTTVSYDAEENNSNIRILL